MEISLTRFLNSNEGTTNLKNFRISQVRLDKMGNLFSLFNSCSNATEETDDLPPCFFSSHPQNILPVSSAEPEISKEVAMIDRLKRISVRYATSVASPNFKHAKILEGDTRKMLLDFEVWGLVMEFIESSKTLFSLMLAGRSLRDYLINASPSSCRNVVFVINSASANVYRKMSSGVAEVVHVVEVRHKKEDFMTYYCNNKKTVAKVGKYDFLLHFKNIRELRLIDQEKFGDYSLPIITQMAVSSLVVLDCPEFSGETLGKFSHMTKLVVQGNDVITDKYLSRCTRLQEISVIHCKNVDGSFLNSLKNVRVLQIEEGVFWSCFQDSYLDSHQLESLKLSWCQKFTGNSFAAFRNSLLELEIVSGLKWNQILDDNLKVLKNLRKLKLISCDYVIGCCFNNFVQLRELEIWNNSNLNDYNLIKLVRVKRLVIVNCENFTGICLAYFKNLEEFFIAKNKRIDDEKLSRAQTVEKLIILDCEKVEFTHISKMKNVKKIKAHNCKNLDDSKIMKWKYMEKIGVYNCPGLQGFGFKKLKYLRKLNVQKCENLEGEEIFKLMKSGVSIKFSVKQYY